LLYGCIVFVDGGVTPYNNPAFILFRMATEPAYRLSWKMGEGQLLIVSVGTGAAESLGATAASPNKNIVSTVAVSRGELMYGIQVDQDVSCRTVGRCTFGAPLDREILDLVPRQCEEGMSLEQQYAAPTVPVAPNRGRSFLYSRYNADLSSTGLKNLGCSNLDASSVQKMDEVENTPLLIEIGRAAEPRVW
jgi:uncharacterized protein